MSLLRRILRGVARRIRNLLAALQSRAARAAARSGRLASIYYALLCSAFRGEHRAMLAGMKRYWLENEVAKGSSPLLRRNIHRLEKGLLMRQRRKVFAADYIGETTTEFLKRAKSTPESENREMAWAQGVLTEYFSVTGSDPRIDRQRARFREFSVAFDANCTMPLVPYKRSATERPTISPESLWKLARFRRSVRWYLRQPVPREVIEKAMEIAAQSPSACNRQPFQFRIFDDRELIKKVAEVPWGMEGYSDNIPALAVVVGQMRNFFDERDRHLIYIDSALAAMSFAFALETFGLASCMVNWPDLEERERTLAKMIGLEADERPIMFISFGYPDPDGLVAASVKKPVSQLIRYNLE